MISGNITGIIQTKTVEKNEIGESVPIWSDAKTITGWLDMVSGSTTYATYNAKIEGSTHVFVMDYKDLGNVTDENSRMIIKGKVYDITFIDNPMELDQQLEIYLNYLGGQKIG